MKPLKVIPPDPADPAWTFPYASRKEIERIVHYFEVHLPNRVDSWASFKGKRHFALPRKEHEQLRKITRWPSVPEKYRQQTEDWFQKKLKQCIEERGFVTPAKLRSMKMNAANFGRNVLTKKRMWNKIRYDRDKAIYLAYKEWLRVEQLKSLPKLRARTLAVA
jgi:hypothetical protein